jgi:hypothetical protein
MRLRTLLLDTTLFLSFAVAAACSSSVAPSDVSEPLFARSPSTGPGSPDKNASCETGEGRKTRTSESKNEKNDCGATTPPPPPPPPPSPDPDPTPTTGTLVIAVSGPPINFGASVFFNGGSAPYCPAVAVGGDGTGSCTATVPASDAGVTYTMTAGTAPFGWAFNSASCSPAMTVAGATATIVVTTGTTVTCTFVYVPW